MGRTQRIRQENEIADRLTSEQHELQRHARQQQNPRPNDGRNSSRTNAAKGDNLMSLLKKGIGYTALAVATAPLWVPAAFAGYVGYKATRYAFKNPKTTLAAIGLAGFLWYATSDRAKIWKMESSRNTATTEIPGQGYMPEAQSLEERIAMERAEHGERANVETETHAQKLRTENSSRPFEEYRATARGTVEAGVTERLKEQPHAREISTKQTTELNSTRTSLPLRPSPESTSKPSLNSSSKPLYPPLEAISEKGYQFYYVKIGETLDAITQKIGGGTQAYSAIIRDNSLHNPHSITTGRLLKIRDSVIKKPAQGLYRRVPRLPFVTLPANVSITDFFHGNQVQARYTIGINRGLGLMYNDASPNKTGAENGERIVYYR